MRMLLHASIPAPKGNEAFDSGELGKIVEGVMANLKPEAAYFYPDQNGNRSALFVFDMEGSWQLPPTVEPLFRGLHAKVYVTPVMNAEDLQRGLQAAMAA